MTRHLLLLLLFFVVACEPDTIDTGSLVFDTGDACGPAAPEITGLAVQGVREPALGLAFLVIAEDEDGALHQSIFRAWIDLSIDGTVNTSRPPDVVFEIDAEAATTVNAVPCETTGGFPMSLIWDDQGTLPMDTAVEVAASIEDADGRLSDEVLASGCTATDAVDSFCIVEG